MIGKRLLVPIGAMILAGLFEMTYARAIREVKDSHPAISQTPPRIGFLSEWRSRFGDGYQHSLSENGPDVDSCTSYNFTQPVDHFAFGAAGHATFDQRYFICNPLNLSSDQIETVFFYFGNEDTVILYVNHTGLMWESAEEFRAILVFAEHRYYGESVPTYRESGSNCLSYLTTEQALADFANLLRHLRESVYSSVPFVGFGGSYGGMIGAWFKVKYPWLIEGVISASAPIWSFLGMNPEYDDQGYNAVVARDAGPECTSALLTAWHTIYNLSLSDDGLTQLQTDLNLCSKPGKNDVWSIIQYFQSPWGYLAMGNYPYPSNYILPSHAASLPAWPLNATCSAILDEAGKGSLLPGLASGMGIFLNATGTLRCNDAVPAKQSLSSPSTSNDDCYGTWDWQWCTEMTQPFSQGLGRDIFWPASPFNLTTSLASCNRTWGAMPRNRGLWAMEQWGGALREKDLVKAENIVFSNGYLDPWSAGGVVKNISDTVVAYLIQSGAHHLDLMFSNPLDTDEVKWVREAEKKSMHSWCEQFHSRLFRHSDL